MGAKSYSAMYNLSDSIRMKLPSVFNVRVSDFINSEHVYLFRNYHVMILFYSPKPSAVPN